jgi:hypothetical protein
VFGGNKFYKKNITTFFRKLELESICLRQCYSNQFVAREIEHLPWKFSDD